MYSGRIADDNGAPNRQHYYFFEKFVDNQTINKVKSETLTKISWLQAYYMCEWFIMYDKVKYCS